MTPEAMSAGATRLLVPLDGSELAEHAVAPAIQVARALHATVLLAQILAPVLAGVTMPGTTVPPDIYEEIDQGERSFASSYLEEIAQKFRDHGVTVRTHVSRGLVLPRLMELELDAQVGLVIMTTHGRTGLVRAALGSIADGLVREGHVPVLLIRPVKPGDACDRLEHALIPLDGRPAAEMALGAALPLIGPLIHRITLLRVLERGDEALMSDAEQYLSNLSLWLESRLSSVPCRVSTVLLKGKAAEMIMQQAREDCDLIIMSTRGTSGASRLAFGSVADRILHDTDVPLLLIQPEHMG